MINEEKINDFLNGRSTAIWTGVLAFVTAFVALPLARVTSASNGTLFDIPDYLSSHPHLSFLLNMGALVGIAALTATLNKRFNFVRSFTFVFSTAFLLLELANPLVSTRFFAGTVLCLVLVLSTFVLFASYQRKNSAQRRIFITFTSLSVCCLFQYAFAFVIVAFFFGFLQMRAMNFKGVLAMLMGIVVPYWILMGTGIVPPQQFLDPPYITVWDNLNDPHAQLVLGTTVATAFLGIALMLLNMITFLNYRLQVRVYNSFFMIMTIIAIIAMGADYRNMLLYVPVLNLCVAIQVAHTFTIQIAHVRRYLILLILAAACVGAWVAHLLI
ncbi:MAG: hypothetical protein IK092_02105 [Muribaculaceae bacterium]|nr:hypothetical protein [Muribaculaceae bacterium]